MPDISRFVVKSGEVMPAEAVGSVFSRERNGTTVVLTFVYDKLFANRLSLFPRLCDFIKPAAP